MSPQSQPTTNQTLIMSACQWWNWPLLEFSRLIWKGPRSSGPCLPGSFQAGGPPNSVKGIFRTMSNGNYTHNLINPKLELPCEGQTLLDRELCLLSE